ncbi:MAG: NINE protein [Gloeomargarita sp. DG_1_5_bins_55]
MSPAPEYVLKFSSPTPAVVINGLRDWQTQGLLDGATVALQVQQREGTTALTLTATTSTQIPQLIQGLGTWAELGLITVPIQGKVILPQLSEPLLAGLDQWLAAGLVTETTVAQFCQTYLCAPLPGVMAAGTSPVGRSALSTGTAYLLWALGFVGLCGLHRLYLGQVLPGLLWLLTLGLCGLGQLVDVFFIPSLTQAANRRRGIVPTVPAAASVSVSPPGQQPAILRSFRAELSVLWLALVGVFLVLISSLVLAASVWEGLGTVGQYGLLWLYTLGFGGMAWWLRSQDHVPLTALMLQVVTVLLIPINFWTMDRLALWSQGSPLLPLLAGLTLTGLGLGLQGRAAMPWGLGWVLLLPWLQSGWQNDGVIYSTVYAGSLLTAAVLFRGRQAAWPVLTWVGIGGGVGLLVIRAILTLGFTAPALAPAVSLNGWLLVWSTRSQPGHRWGILGGILAFLGWLWANPMGSGSWPAFITLFFVGELLYQHLRRTQTVPALLGWLGLPLQVFWWLWTAIPPAGQAQVWDWAEAVGGTLGMPTVLLSLLWLPAVGLTLWARRWLAQWAAPRLVRMSGIFALALGSGLAVLSLSNPTWRIGVWGVCTLYLWLWLRGERSVRLGWVYLLQGLALSTCLFLVDRIAPALPNGIWVLLLFILAAGEWCWSCTAHPWRQTGWPVGLVLMGLGYWQWLAWVWGGGGLHESVVSDNGWVLSAFIPGIALSILSFQPQCIAPYWSVGIAVAGAFGSAMLLPPVHREWLGLLLATAVAGVGAWRWPHGFPGVVALTLAFALWERLVPMGVAAPWRPAIVTAFVLMVWAGRHLWAKGSATASQIYAKISDWWAGLFSGLILAAYTYSIANQVYGGSLDNVMSLLSEQTGLVTVGVVTVGLAYRGYQQPQAWVRYGLVWGLEVALALAALTTPDAGFTFGLGNAVLGVLTLLLWGWRGIALFLGAVGFGVGLSTPLTGVTGWLSLALGVIGLTGGQRWQQAPGLTYGGLGVITLGLYQFLLYRLLQLPAGKPGDAWTVLAALAVGLSYGYGGLSRWWGDKRWGGVTAAQLRRVGHGHWGLAVGLAAVRLGFPTSSQGVVGHAIVLLLCGVYALGYGRQQGVWVWGGLAAVLAAWGDMLVLLVPETQLLNGAGTLAGLLGVLLMSAPWQRWGWAEVRPWQEVGLWVPGVNILLMAGVAGGARVTWPNLLVTAAFYAWSARTNLRRSYVSLLLLDWGLVKFLREQGWPTFLLYGFIVGVSLLYWAQVDPDWRQADTRQRRHGLRCLATGLLGLTAIWESQGSWPAGLLTMGLGLGLAGLGLGLRVRAYLLVGTLIFAVQTLVQVWLFVTTSSIWLWALGLALGVVMLWVAATFETRRAQVMMLVQTFFQTGLADWE